MLVRAAAQMLALTAVPAFVRLHVIYLAIILVLLVAQSNVRKVVRPHVMVIVKVSVPPHARAPVKISARVRAAVTAAPDVSIIA